MTPRWKLVLVGLLVFQWVQAAVFWHLMDVIRYQAEDSWLHETAWGPATMRWVWLVGGAVTVIALAVLVIDVRGAVERLGGTDPAGSRTPPDTHPPSGR